MSFLTAVEASISFPLLLVVRLSLQLLDIYFLVSFRCKGLLLHVDSTAVFVVLFLNGFGSRSRLLPDLLGLEVQWKELTSCKFVHFFDFVGDVLFDCLHVIVFIVIMVREEGAALTSHILFEGPRTRCLRRQSR